MFVVLPHQGEESTGMTISRGRAGYSGEQPEAFDVALARLSSSVMVLLVG